MHRLYATSIFVVLDKKVLNMVKIPSRLEDLLPLAAYEKVVDLLHRPDLSGRVREALGKVGLQELNPLEQVQDAWQQAKTWLSTLSAQDPSGSQHWINATGQLFPAGLDRAPMIPAAGLSLARTAASFQVRSAYIPRAQATAQTSLGSAGLAWLSEPFSALSLTIHSCFHTSATRSNSNFQQNAAPTVLIARADCVRIPSLGDVRAMLAACSNVVEVGANNATSEQDWQLAMQQNPGSLIVLLSPGGLPTEQALQSRSAAIETSKKHQSKVIELLVDGCLNRALNQSLGFPHPADRLSSGADVVLMPTDFLLGGSRGVLCLGQSELIARVQAMASLWGVDQDSCSLAANVLAIQLACLEGEVDYGLLGGLQANPENLRNRCQRLAVQLGGLGPIQSADVIESECPLGGSPWDRYTFCNAAIKLNLSEDIAALENRLAQADHDRPAIMLRRLQGALQVDLRFVHPEDDHFLVSAVRSLKT